MTAFLLAFGVYAMSAPPIDPAAIRFENLPVREGIPDLLTSFSGKPIPSAESWQKARRPELKWLFQELMYGRYPSVAAKVRVEVKYEDRQAYGGKATLRDLDLYMAEKAPPVQVLLVIPNGQSKPVGAFVGLNFNGNHTFTSDPGVRISTSWFRPSKGPEVKGNRATEAGRGKKTDWPLEMIISRGYAVATVYYGDILPDDAKVKGGLCEFLMTKSEGEIVSHATGSIMGWAWGIHRVIDYLVTVPEIDAKRIATVGHSRLGKTAILAAAFDDRVAMTIANQAGCGGTSPNRMKNPKGETVQRITKAFPHWFAPAFTEFGKEPARLPFDQHALVAICAPRPVLFTNAQEDQWADPAGQFEILQAANPVYELLGVKGVEAKSMPELNTLVPSRLGYWIRPGEHAMTPADWSVYLQFADLWLKP